MGCFSFLAATGVLSSLTNTGLETITGATSLTQISSMLQSNYGIVGDAISLVADSNLGQTVKFEIHPKYTEFYRKVKEHMKSMK